ncbi:hypothetical protein [Pseudomonas sp. MWU318]|uniref:hypothetical protein n=1 Tax=Pseudomonas sp. MWU318 TaxID=2802569 RepID=UPI001927A019|nr:hypothetical protein [Pseudomonas sp. MWU318]
MTIVAIKQAKKQKMAAKFKQLIFPAASSEISTLNTGFICRNFPCSLIPPGFTPPLVAGINKATHAREQRKCANAGKIALSIALSARRPGIPPCK